MSQVSQIDGKGFIVEITATFGSRFALPAQMEARIFSVAVSEVLLLQAQATSDFLGEQIIDISTIDPKVRNSDVSTFTMKILDKNGSEVELKDWVLVQVPTQ